MPISFVIDGDVVEDLVTVFKGVTPPDMHEDLDQAYAHASIMAWVEGEARFLGRQMFLGTSESIWLDLHLIDEGLGGRQAGETDPQGIARGQHPPQAGTVSAIYAALTAIVGDGVVLVELPRQSMYTDRRCFLDRGSRAGARRGMVIALIPASANALASASAALRQKASAGKVTLVCEYTT